VKSYVTYYSLHRNLPCKQYPCCVAACQNVFSTYFGLKSHVRRIHFTSSVNIRKYKPLCAQLSCKVFSCGKTLRSMNDFIAHLKSHLQDGSGTQVLCPYEGCDKIFRIKSSFTSHLSRKHRDSSVSAPAVSVTSEPMCIADEEMISTESDIMNASEQNEFFYSIALFYLKLQAKFLLPATTIQSIINEFQTVHEIGQKHVVGLLKKKLLALDVSADVVDQVLGEFNRIDILKQCNEGILRSDASRKSFYKSNFCYVEPVELYLGQDEAGKHRYCYYVPIKLSLQALFQQESVVQQYKSTHAINMQKDMLEDIADGAVFKNSTFFVNNPSAVKLLLYADAFEVANPLGSGRKKHKIHAVYYILGDLEAYNRSNIDQIQLVLLCREADLKKFGIEKSYEKLISDLKELETSGIQIAGNKVKGTVLSVCGDNLGSHEIGGFSVNFSSGEYFCRYCMIQRQTFRSIPYSLGCLRTVENYSEAVLSQSLGICGPSVFNDLHYFHVCQPGLAPCLAHDLFEGVVSKDMALFIKYFVKRKWFTYDHLNRVIERFHYVGTDASDKPAIIRKFADKLGGQAIQNWCLLRLFPILIFKWVNCEDKVWELFLMLRELVLLIVAPKLSVDQVGYLKCLIEQYLEARFVLFPDDNLRPKHHYLLHYPHLILQFGPLIRLWTMRFESKHKYFKQCIKKLQNFKNVCKTAAERHQLLQAYLGTGCLFNEPVVCDKALDFNPADFSCEIQQAVADLEIDCENTIVCHTMTYRGTEYRKNLYVMVKEDERGLIFGRIMLVLIKQVVEKEVFLVLQLVPAEQLVKFDVYHLSDDDSSTVFCCAIDTLLDYYPLSSYEVDGMTLLSLHHTFASNFS
jgi:hypothetical protein